MDECVWGVMVTVFHRSLPWLPEMESEKTRISIDKKKKKSLFSTVLYEFKPLCAYLFALVIDKS